MLEASRRSLLVGWTLWPILLRYGVLLLEVKVGGCTGGGCSR